MLQIKLVCTNVCKNVWVWTSSIISFVVSRQSPPDASLLWCPWKLPILWAYFIEETGLLFILWKTSTGRFCTLSHVSLFMLLAYIYTLFFACKFPRGKNELISERIYFSICHYPHYFRLFKIYISTFFSNFFFILNYPHYHRQVETFLSTVSRQSPLTRVCCDAPGSGLYCERTS